MCCIVFIFYFIIILLDYCGTWTCVEAIRFRIIGDNEKKNHIVLIYFFFNTHTHARFFFQNIYNYNNLKKRIRRRKVCQTDSKTSTKRKSCWKMQKLRLWNSSMRFFKKKIIFFSNQVVTIIHCIETYRFHNWVTHIHFFFKLTIFFFYNKKNTWF